MKYIPILFFLLLSFAINAQEPPPYFRFRIQDEQTNKEHLLHKFEFSTEVFTKRIHRNRCGKSPWKNHVVYHSDHSGLYVHLTNSVTNLPKKGNTLQLQITERLTGQTMNLFFRIDHDMDFGERIELESIPFKAGNYFYNFRSKRKFKARSIQQYNIHLEGHALEKRKTSIARINRIILLAVF